MDIQIFGESELIRRLEKKEPVHSHCISITNFNRSSPVIIRKSFVKVLYIHFSDTDADSPSGPKFSDIKKVIDFYQGTRDEATGYTIHCYRGISQSAAIAAGLLFMESRSERNAIESLMKFNHSVNPSKAVLRLFDQLIASDFSCVDDLLASERYKQGKR